MPPSPAPRKPRTLKSAAPEVRPLAALAQMLRAVHARRAAAARAKKDPVQVHGDHERQVELKKSSDVK